MDLTTRAKGCLLAAAYGDMLGAAVEFASLDRIRSQYGPQGITVPCPAFGFPYPIITDDTQMAIATARGIVSSLKAGKLEDQEILKQIWVEYQEWYRSQSDPEQSRAPGSTCLSALARGVMGSTRHKINGSAGCGGIMRVHPIGITYHKDPQRAYILAAEAAALTHGSPQAYLPSGMLAAIIALLFQEESFIQAVQSAYKIGKKLFPHEMESITETIWQAVVCDVSADPGMTIDRYIGRTPGKGGGWLGHDALAIAIYAIRCAPNDPLQAVNIAVNHTGDSDSTGSIVGSIVGTIFGADSFLNHLGSHQVDLERQAELEGLCLKLLS